MATESPIQITENPVSEIFNPEQRQTIKRKFEEILSSSLECVDAAPFKKAGFNIPFPQISNPFADRLLKMQEILVSSKYKNELNEFATAHPEMKAFIDEEMLTLNDSSEYKLLLDFVKAQIGL